MAETQPRQRRSVLDLDKTLMAGSTGMVFARIAHRRGVFPAQAARQMGLGPLRYRCMARMTRRRTRSWRSPSEILANAPLGKSADGAQVLAGILPRVYPQMLAEVHRHQDAGREDLHR